MLTGMENSDELAAAIRRACIEILLDAHEDAGIQGLCAEGRFEVAVARVRATPIEELLARGRAQAK
jgi:hypothetical protein